MQYIHGSLAINSLYCGRLHNFTYLSSETRQAYGKGCSPTYDIQVQIQGQYTVGEVDMGADMTMEKNVETSKNSTKVYIPKRADCST